ncbi:M12 family metallopeptidase, partial [Paraherbaspirillum soli]
MLTHIAKRTLIASLLCSGTFLLPAAASAQTWSETVASTFQGNAALRIEAPDAATLGLDHSRLTYTWTVPAGWAHGPDQGAAITVWAPDTTSEAEGEIKLQLSDGNRTAELKRKIIGNASFAAASGSEKNTLDQLKVTELKRDQPLRSQSMTVRLSNSVDGSEFDADAVKIGDQLVYQGDMILGEGKGFQARGMQAKQTKLWRNGVVPYSIDPAFPPVAVQAINDAIKQFDLHTQIRFVPRTEADQDSVYFRHTGATGCNSYPGRKGGVQDLNLASGCFPMGIIMHEMMHAIGFMHEHMRHDRDSYVHVQYPNITQGEEHNFRKIPDQQSVTYGDYDYASLLHYGRYAFSIGKDAPTIIAPEGVAIGVRTGFSAGDALLIKQVYSAPQNEEPVARLTGPAQAEAESLVTLDASASSDPDGDALSYVWQAPEGIQLTSDGARASFTVPALTVDRPFTFTVDVQDGKETVSAQHTVLVKAQPPKAPPEVVLTVVDSVESGGTIAVDVDARSASGHPLTYTWARTKSLFGGGIGNKPAGSYQVAAVDKDAKGRISVTVSDGKHEVKREQIVTVKAPAVPQNEKPVAHLTGPAQAEAESLVTLDASASSDPDGDALSYVWHAPEGIQLTPDGARASFTVPALTVDRPFTFTVDVQDGKETVSAQHTVLVKAQPPKAPPEVVLRVVDSVESGGTIAVDVDARSASGHPLTYTWARTT